MYCSGACCSQILWMAQQLQDVRINLKGIPIKCDSTSAIFLNKNLMQHSRTKHIEVRHPFIRAHVEKGNVALSFIQFNRQFHKVRFIKPKNEHLHTHIRV